MAVTVERGVVWVGVWVGVIGRGDSSVCVCVIGGGGDSRNACGHAAGGG